MNEQNMVGKKKPATFGTREILEKKMKLNQILMEKKTCETYFNNVFKQGTSNKIF